jgi:hypothetical protein
VAHGDEWETHISTHLLDPLNCSSVIPGICSGSLRQRNTSFQHTKPGKLRVSPQRTGLVFWVAQLHQSATPTQTDRRNRAAETALAGESSLIPVSDALHGSSAMQARFQRPAPGLQQQNHLHTRPLLKAGRPFRPAGALVCLLAIVCLKPPPSRVGCASSFHCASPLTDCDPHPLIRSSAHRSAWPRRWRGRGQHPGRAPGLAAAATGTAPRAPPL